MPAIYPTKSMLQAQIKKQGKTATTAAIVNPVHLEEVPPLA